MNERRNELMNGAERSQRPNDTHNSLSIWHHAPAGKLFLADATAVFIAVTGEAVGLLQQNNLSVEYSSRTEILPLLPPSNRLCICPSQRQCAPK